MNNESINIKMKKAKAQSETHKYLTQQSFATVHWYQYHVIA